VPLFAFKTEAERVAFLFTLLRKTDFSLPRRKEKKHPQIPPSQSLNETAPA
jgi:hypothetical protein